MCVLLSVPVEDTGNYICVGLRTWIVDMCLFVFILNVIFLLLLTDLQFILYLGYFSFRE